jgi:hypothetical protein
MPAKHARRRHTSLSEAERERNNAPLKSRRIVVR